MFLSWQLKCWPYITYFTFPTSTIQMNLWTLNLLQTLKQYKWMHVQDLTITYTFNNPLLALLRANTVYLYPLFGQAYKSVFASYLNFLTIFWIYTSECLVTYCSHTYLDVYQTSSFLLTSYFREYNRRVCLFLICSDEDLNFKTSAVYTQWQSQLFHLINSAK